MPELALSILLYSEDFLEALAGRLEDCDSKYIITADEGVRGGKTIPLKENVDKAVSKIKDFKKCVVVKRTGNAINWNNSIDHWYDDLVSSASAVCEPKKCLLRTRYLFCTPLALQEAKRCITYHGRISCICISHTSIYL